MAAWNVDEHSIRIDVLQWMQQRALPCRAQQRDQRNAQ